MRMLEIRECWKCRKLTLVIVETPNHNGFTFTCGRCGNIMKV